MEAVDAGAAGVAEGGGVVKHVQRFGCLMFSFVALLPDVPGENEEEEVPAEEVNIPE